MSAAQPAVEAALVTPPEPATNPTENPSPPAPAAAPASWQAQHLDPDLRQEATLGRYKSVTELAKAHLEARAKLSEKGLILPKADAPPEAWNEVYTALGRPESAEQYELGEWKPPENVPWDAGFQAEALSKFHEAGLTSKQAQALLGWYTGKGMAGIEAQQQRSQDVQAQWAEQVTKKWGQAAPAKLDLANRTFDTFFPDAVRQSIIDAVTPDGGPLGEHPAFLEAMAAIGQHLAEHQLLGDKEPIRHAKTPEEATAELQKLGRNSDWLKRFAAGDPEAIAEHDNLVRQTLLEPNASPVRHVSTR